jgi:RNA polymerase sigma-70 factor, ECF subfamily
MLRRSDLNPHSPPALLYKIATDVCLNVLRTKRRHPETPGDELLHSIATWDDAANEAEHRSVLDRLFHRESPSTRTMAVLHWVDGLTLEEVAKVVGLSVSGVRKRLRVLQSRVPDVLGDAS